ncbi:hypothetical protein HDU78_011367 [Chytriomyces hyalinus]|nr:hypothetical protein HDU78_011367 [Chytriomyces hyalinus]
MHASQTPLPKSQIDNSDTGDTFDELIDRSAVGGTNENGGGDDENDGGNVGNDGGSGGNDGGKDVELCKLPEPMPFPNLMGDVGTA